MNVLPPVQWFATVCDNNCSSFFQLEFFVVKDRGHYSIIPEFKGY